MDYIEEIDSIGLKLKTAVGNDYESLMARVAELIVEASSGDHFDLEPVLLRGLAVLSSFAGSHDELEVLEKSLDRLYDQGLIDSKRYNETVQNSACGRWL